MAFARIQSAQLLGLRATEVLVEVDISRGLYMFQIVGLPDKSVEESRERVVSALRNSIDKNPKAQNHKVLISLSPAELKKEGAYFDLAIAMAYLVATGEVRTTVSGKLFIGELSLNGDLRPICGLLSIAQWAIESGIQELYIPATNADEASLIEGITIYLVPTLSSLIAHFNDIDSTVVISLYTPFEPKQKIETVGFHEIHGQESAKRALVIAASGGHNVILYGPPGTGKSMLARAFHSILPALNQKDFIEVARTYSSIGQIEEVLNGCVPIRNPHHTASHVAVIGGGKNLRPGDISLAHRGVLYLDEFPEFDRRIIEALREPLEEGTITVARAKGSVQYPAQFILLAAMNPCPCGYRGTAIRTCSCTTTELSRYTKKLSGPIMDRIDLWVPVSHIEYETLHQNNKNDTSTQVTVEISMRIEKARALQYKRAGILNSLLSTTEVQDTNLSLEAKQQLQLHAEKMHLSPRVYLRTIKIARTIADLSESETIETSHVLEALQYRPKL